MREVLFQINEEWLGLFSKWSWDITGGGEEGGSVTLRHSTEPHEYEVKRIFKIEPLEENKGTSFWTGEGIFKDGRKPKSQKEKTDKFDYRNLAFLSN